MPGATAAAVAHRNTSKKNPNTAEAGVAGMFGGDKNRVAPELTEVMGGTVRQVGEDDAQRHSYADTKPSVLRRCKAPEHHSCQDDSPHEVHTAAEPPFTRAHAHALPLRLLLSQARAQRKVVSVVSSPPRLAGSIARTWSSGFSSKIAWSWVRFAWSTRSWSSRCS